MKVKTSFIIAMSIYALSASSVQAAGERYYFRFGPGVASTQGNTNGTGNNSGQTGGGNSGGETGGSNNGGQQTPLQIGQIGLGFSAGQSISEVLNVSGGVGPYVWSISDRPTWLNLSGNTLSGTVPGAGTWTFNISVKDANNNSGSQSFTITATAVNGAIVRDDINPVPFVREGEHSQTYSVSGVDLSNAKLSVANLPSGLSARLDKTLSKVVIGGIPSVAGFYGISISVTDDNGASASFLDDLDVKDAVVVSGYPDFAYRGEVFDFRVSAAGGNGGPYKYKLGGWPEYGMNASVTLDGRVSGTFTNLFQINLEIEDGKGVISDSYLTVIPNYKVKVYDLPVINSVSVPHLYKSEANYTNIYLEYQLLAQFGAGQLSWSVENDSLPPGLSVSASGLLSGNPTLAGNYNMIATVTDVNGRTATKSIAIQIRDCVGWTCPN